MTWRGCQTVTIASLQKGHTQRGLTLLISLSLLILFMYESHYSDGRSHENPLLCHFLTFFRFQTDYEVESAHSGGFWPIKCAVL